MSIPLPYPLVTTPQQPGQVDPYAAQANFDALATAMPAASPTSARVATARKTADETVTSSTTLQDDDHLKLTVAANEAWQTDWNLLLDAQGTAGDFKFGFTGPAGATFYWAPLPHLTSAGAVGHWGATDSLYGGPAPLALLPIGSTISLTGISGVFGVFVKGTYAGSSTAGTLQLQWAQVTSSGTGCKVLTGSNLIATKTSA